MKLVLMKTVELLFIFTSCMVGYGFIIMLSGGAFTDGYSKIMAICLIIKLVAMVIIFLVSKLIARYYSKIID